MQYAALYAALYAAMYAVQCSSDQLWCGVVWCGVVWCGVVWCGVVWCGVKFNLTDLRVNPTLRCSVI